MRLVVCVRVSKSLRCIFVFVYKRLIYICALFTFLFFSFLLSLLGNMYFFSWLHLLLQCISLRFECKKMIRIVTPILMLALRMV